MKKAPEGTGPFFEKGTSAFSVFLRRVGNAEVGWQFPIGIKNLIHVVPAKRRDPSPLASKVKKRPLLRAET
jgi:hypothetical protein